MKAALMFGGRVLYWLGWPVWRVVMPRSVRTRVFVVCDGEVLVVRPILGSGNWSLPGGGLHRGEDARRGARREVAEETGIVLDPQALVDFGLHESARNGIKLRGQYFGAQLYARPKLQLQKREIAAAEWRPPDTVDALREFAALRRAYEKWRNT